MIRISWLIAILFIPVASMAQGYYAGGTKPFSTEQKAVLDRNAEILSLGVNRDWLTQSRIDIDAYVAAIDEIGDAVRTGSIPGAVILADRFNENTMAAAIGYMMTDPKRVRAEYDTRYFVGDMTGPLLTTPLVLTAMGDGRFALGDTVGELVPELAGTSLADLTVEMLLRHSSGLPAEIPKTDPIEAEDEFWQALAALKPGFEPGTRVQHSPLNFLLLGLILESSYEQRYQEVAQPYIETFFGGGLASLSQFRTSLKIIAPGEYNPWLRRMAWAEPDEPLGLFLRPNAGHTGLTVEAADVREQCKNLMSIASIHVNYEDPSSTDTLSLAFHPDPSIPGGETMGLGFQLGRFGPKSFGWDSPTGSSFWILPEKFGYVIYLSNPWHPERPGEDWEDPREVALSLLEKSLLPVGPGVDTLPAKEDASGSLTPSLGNEAP